VSLVRQRVRNTPCTSSVHTVTALFKNWENVMSIGKM
jgi:hypothetical protein